MSSLVYAAGKACLLRHSWVKAPYGVLLATSRYEPDHSHKFVSDVGGELWGVKRQVLTGRAIKTSKSGRVSLVANTTTFQNIETRQAYRWVIVFRATGQDHTSNLVAAIDMTNVPLEGKAVHYLCWNNGAKRGRVIECP